MKVSKQGEHHASGGLTMGMLSLVVVVTMS